MELVTLLTPKHTSCQLGSLTEWVSSPSYVYLRLRSAGRRPKVALVVAMRKLLVAVWSV